MENCWILTNGLIEQWGYDSTSTSGSGSKFTEQLNISYSNTNYVINCIPYSTTQQYSVTIKSTPTVNSFEVQTYQITSGSSDRTPLRFQTKGY